MLKGCTVALVTPFKNDRVDYPALQGLLEVHIAAQTDAVLVCGTTGESATLSHKEHKEIMSFAAAFMEEKRKTLRGSCPKLIAGTGSNSTYEAIELTAHAKQVGIPVSLLITPYYNRPPQAGLISHYTKVAEEVGQPIILYNVPSRTGVNLEADTVVELSAIHNIVGVKEASGNTTQISEIIRQTPEDFLVLSGDDAMTLSIVSMGGHGVISVVANVVPEDMTNMVHAAARADMDTARTLHHKMVPLIRALFTETNPIPVKSALQMLKGQRTLQQGPVWPDVGDLRLPLVPASDKTMKTLKTTLQNYGIDVPE